jgi:hypothetical protein
VSLEEIGCCGAYCGTCPVRKENMCRGCKLGYQTGERDLSKARCQMKVCCIGKGFSSCADCDDYTHCETLQEFYGKNGYKYKKYKEAVDFIRQNGYDAFIAIADTWKRQCGKYS